MRLISWPRMSEKFACIGDLGGKLNQLLALRDKLVSRRSPIGEDKWMAFETVAYKISEAIEGRDIESLAIAVRQMKNRLRRPYVKNALLAMSENKSAQDSKPDGYCVCAECGDIIENSTSPCVDGSLCVKCGMAKNVKGASDGDEDEPKVKRRDDEPK